MELGHSQAQVFLSVVVILGAAFVALICDLMRGRNEQLRELATELQVRCEEGEKLLELALSQAADPIAAAKVQTLNGAAQSAPRLASAGATVAAQVELSSPSQSIEKRSGGRSKERPKRAIAPEALAAMERGAMLATSPRPRRIHESVTAISTAKVTVAQPVAEVVKTERLESILETIASPAVAAPSLATRSLASQPVATQTVAEHPFTAQAVSIQSVLNAPKKPRDWGSFLNNHRPNSAAKNKPREQSELLDAVMVATDSEVPAEPSLPAGFQPHLVLTRLMEGRQVVSGLVVSIGVTQDDAGDAPAEVQEFLQSLIGPKDFAAQSGHGEFLLVYPGERGAAAQRKLAQIAEHLWDFQLRSMGTLPIQFCWGGIEVRSESIDEAAASAIERMRETRHSRSKILTMEARPEVDELLEQAV